MQENGLAQTESNSVYSGLRSVVNPEVWGWSEYNLGEMTRK